MDALQFTLNGQLIRHEGDATARLLDVLRDTYGCTSVKCGCCEGECGACSVLIDGVLANSCCVAVGAVDGHQVTTLEGYRDSARFAVLNKTFADVAAVQCGYCTPGMVLAAEALLAQNPHPSEDDIRLALSGNICRCTGYNAIVTAVQRAAQEGNGLW